jgi:hypothetical protein
MRTYRLFMAQRLLGNRLDCALVSKFADLYRAHQNGTGYL